MIDTTPPTLHLRGNSVVELQYGAKATTDEFHRLARSPVTDSANSGYYCTDACAAGVQHTVSVYRHTCAGKFECIRADESAPGVYGYVGEDGAAERRELRGSDHAVRVLVEICAELACTRGASRR